MTDISITCIDAIYYQPTIIAIKETLKCIDASKLYWFSDIDFPEDIGIPVEWISIPKFSANFLADYNYISLKLVPHHVTTEYNLIIQADGFAVNKDAWTTEFLEYDYIGAIWPWHPVNRVGNGGFSLRSKKLYDALNDMNVPLNFVDHNGKELIFPEDDIICRVYREALENNYGIKFAPEDLADRFSIEHNTASPWLGKSFGFHSKHGVEKYYNITLVK